MEIDKDKHVPLDAAELRRQAEERLQAKRVELPPPRSEEETRRLVHELEVHQIELEMQNAELCQTRDELETALVMYTDLYDFAPVGYVTIDLKETIISVNFAGARLLGFERTRLIGRRFGHFVAPDSRPAFAAFSEKVFTSLAKETCEIELMNEGKQPLFVQLSAVNGGSGHEILMGMIDITERKLMETSLKRSEEKKRIIIHTAMDGFWLVDSQGNLLEVNESYSRMSGYSIQELQAMSIPDLEANETTDNTAEHLLKVITQGEDRFESRHRRKDGSIFDVEISVQYQSLDGRFVVFLRDITKRRHLEDALAEKRQELEQLNISLNERIILAAAELHRKDQLLIIRERLASMGEMIGNIAHQWRQPLNRLGLHIQILQQFYGSEEFDRDFLEDNTDKAMVLIKHMSQTIDDFTNFFRTDKKVVTFGIIQVISHTLSLIEQSLQEQQIGIALSHEGNPLANGYPNEYSQVLLNILMNARDALIGNNVADALISIRAFKEEDSSVVTITDNAGGIADEIIDRLFEPYFSTKGLAKGTGIGLYMSKTIIEKSMRGRLTVRNTGNGAEFRIEV